MAHYSKNALKEIKAALLLSPKAAQNLRSFYQIANTSADLFNSKHLIAVVCGIYWDIIYALRAIANNL